MDVIQKKNVKDIEEELGKIRMFFKKYKDGSKLRTSIVRLDQPVMMLIRRNNKAEICEATKKNLLASGKFKYENSDGKECIVNLDSSYLITGDYGNDNFKFFMLHEDSAFPYPPQPIFELEQFTNAVHNAMSAEMKWKAEEKKATARLVQAIAIILGVVFGGIILYKLVVPSPDNTIIYNLPNASNVTANLTNLAIGNTSSLIDNLRGLINL